jgi:hypothetical protein
MRKFRLPGDGQASVAPPSAQNDHICAAPADSGAIGEKIHNGGYACGLPRRLDHAP